MDPTATADEQRINAMLPSLVILGWAPIAAGILAAVLAKKNKIAWGVGTWVIGGAVTGFAARAMLANEASTLRKLSGSP